MATVTDPVCGMEIDSQIAAGQSGFEGETYYFCANSCKDKFDANPQQFAKSEGRSAGGGA